MHENEGLPKEYFQACTSLKLLEWTLKKRASGAGWRSGKSQLEGIFKDGLKLWDVLR